MKRGKDEEKITGPMFPRLHVNDTEKGGPKAPPRNKMALYEQLSISSQRFNHSVLPIKSNAKASNLEPSSNQGVQNARNMFFPCQLPTRNQSQKLYSQYSEINIPLTQVEQTKKSDENEFRVPIFIQSLQGQQCGKQANDLNGERPSDSSPSNFSRPLNFHKFKKTGTLESSMRQECKSQNEESSREFLTDRVNATSSFTAEKAGGLRKQPDSSACHELRDSAADSNGGVETQDIIELELHANSQHVSADDIAFNSSKENQKSLGNVRNYTSKGKPCRQVATMNLEMGDSMSGVSVVDSVSRLVIKPDDVVEIIGQKHFWKARKAILNQQRVFAVQVFELHRLVKVQRSIATSPQLLADDSAYVGKPPVTKIPLSCPVKAISNVPKQKGELEKPTQEKESSAENTVGKLSLSSIQNGVPLPPSGRPLTGNSPVPSGSSNQNASPWCFDQPQGHHWLIPVMSPSEGLVYKPYPGPGFSGPACAGQNPLPCNFLPPAYGIPAPHPPYHMPSFPPAQPHGYFPTYGMPIMNHPPIPSQSSCQEADAGLTRAHGNHASSDAMDRLRGSNGVEVQASTASSPVERSQDGRSDDERSNMLLLFPTAPFTDRRGSSPCRPCPIKVVPHNAITATESAARIFRSIQEERKQYDSV